jgi:hypothetical protein
LPSKIISLIRLEVNIPAHSFVRTLQGGSRQDNMDTLPLDVGHGFDDDDVEVPPSQPRESESFLLAEHPPPMDETAFQEELGKHKQARNQPV